MQQGDTVADFSAIDQGGNFADAETAASLQLPRTLPQPPMSETDNPVAADGAHPPGLPPRAHWLGLPHFRLAHTALQWCSDEAAVG